MRKIWANGSVIILLLIVTALVVAGCGQGRISNDAQDRTQEKGEETSVSTDTVTDTGSEDTRIIKHAKGEIEIPAHPQRIVTTHYLGDYLALGVKPVGSQGYLIADHYLKEASQGIENIGEPPNPEQVLSLSPDLIVAHDEPEYQALKNIAPTVLIPWDAHGPEERLKLIGQIVNKEAEANDWWQSFEQEVEAAKSTIGEHMKEGETVSFIWLADKYIQVYTQHNVLYGLLGLQEPEQVAAYAADNPDQIKVLVSLENLPDYASDHLFLIIAPDEKSQSAAADIKASLLWQGLPAVKQGQLYEVEESSWISSDPISLQGQLREAVEKLSGN